MEIRVEETTQVGMYQFIYKNHSTVWSGYEQYCVHVLDSIQQLNTIVALFCRQVLNTHHNLEALSQTSVMQYTALGGDRRKLRYLHCKHVVRIMHKCSMHKCSINTLSRGMLLIINTSSIVYPVPKWKGLKFSNTSFSILRANYPWMCASKINRHFLHCFVAREMDHPCIK